MDGEAVDHRLAFVATGGRSYRLEYGSDSLERPRYDADAVLDALGDARREAAGLSPQIPYPGYRPGRRRMAVAPSPWLFLAIILMTAVLAWAVLQAVRRTDKRAMDEFD